MNKKQLIDVDLVKSRGLRHAIPQRQLHCNPDLGSHELTRKTILVGRSQQDAQLAEQLLERAPLIAFDDGTVVSIATYRAHRAQVRWMVAVAAAPVSDLSHGQARALVTLMRDGISRATDNQVSAAAFNLVLQQRFPNATKQERAIAFIAWNEALRHMRAALP